VNVFIYSCIQREQWPVVILEGDTLAARVMWPRLFIRQWLTDTAGIA
jgi:hypothetical protein